MVGISENIIAKWLSDDFFVEHMGNLESAFRAGDRSALWAALSLCATFQAVMPDWVADELIAYECAHENGKFAGLNEFFGDGKTAPTAQGKRRAAANRKRLTAKVTKHLVELLKDGATLSAEDALQRVADKLDLGRRDVEAIYKSNKWVVPFGRAAKGSVVGRMNARIPVYRRTGRETLGRLEGYTAVKTMCDES